MARLIATAEDFAFGPAGKLVTVAEELSARGHTLTFAGSGTALQLAERADCWDEVFACPTDGPEFEELVSTRMAGTDLLLSCVDRPSVELARKHGLPVAWLDPLTWWWGDEAPPWLPDLELCVVQRSIGADDAAGPYQELPANHVLVGPIVRAGPERRGSAGSGPLLVNFGGGEAANWYQPGRDTNYPYVIIDLLLTQIDLTGFSQIVVASGERIAAEARRRWPDAPVTFECLGHRDFVERLSSARTFLTVPGLEAPLEGWAAGVPTLFLPPSNSSQYVQLDEFRRRGVGDLSVHLRDFLPPLDLRSAPLRERSDRFIGQLRDFERTPMIRTEVAARLNDLLTHPEAWMPAVQRGHAYLDELGRDGLERCVAAICALLEREGESA